MADIFDVSDMIERMVDGFEPQVMQCLGDNSDIAEDAIREQMFSGQDGEGKMLNPNYDNDPYFDQPGPWYHRSEGYKHWKMDITPPCPGIMLMLPPRPDNVPNLYINGKFHSEVFATLEGDTFKVDVLSDGDGPAIVAKYGDNLLRLSPTAVGYLNQTYVIPHIWNFFEDCGYTE